MSRLTQQIAKHLKELYFGGNWTCSNVNDQLSDVTWKEAITPVQSLNTIATLAFHTHYYVAAQRVVLEGGRLEANDKLSFNHPPIASEQDWQQLKEMMFAEAAALAKLIEQLPEDRLWENFTDEKYGNYYRNLCGMIEHTHYHLGQIAVVKKLLRRVDDTTYNEGKAK